MSSFFSRFLTTDGTSGGSSDMDVNGSGTPVKFWTSPPAGRAVIIRRVMVYFEEGAISAANYGVVPGLLTNGLNLELIDTDGTTVLLDLLDGRPVKSAGDWRRLAFTAERLTWAAAEESMSVKWDFSAQGKPIVLLPDQRLQMTVSDNLTELDTHTCVAQGEFLSLKAAQVQDF